MSLSENLNCLYLFEQMTEVDNKILNPEEFVFKTEPSDEFGLLFFQHLISVVLENRISFEDLRCCGINRQLIGALFY